MKRVLIAVVSLVAACGNERGQDSRGAPDTRSTSSHDKIAECAVTWKNGSEVCNSQRATSACTTLFRGSYATLEDAQQGCKRSYGAGTSTGAEACDSCRWVSADRER